MMRTRDLILFVLTILFLMVTISTTFLSQSPTVITPEVAFVDTQQEHTATTLEKTVDRQKNIEDLRRKISESTQDISPVASVASIQSEVDDNDVPAIASGVQKCLYPDDSLSMVPRWPLAEVQVRVKEGARIVYFTQEIIIPVISSSGTSTSNTTPSIKKEISIQSLLQLPLQPQKTPDVSCVPSEVIGVTNGGILMFNGDVNSYRKISENTLIGYARDGFPIYGVYEGEVDTCGGYDAPGGYRYTISTERDYIVGCFIGNVQKFNL